MIDEYSPCEAKAERLDHDTLRAMKTEPSPIEDVINAARNGRMTIVVDEGDPDCEGTLVFPAQMVTPDVINFMAKHGRGLVCLALTRERTEELGLELMGEVQSRQRGTDFATSIEARHGITTGISAADRARTVQVAIDRSCGAADIATPGHVFPVVCRKGGVLMRAGHTEAAVDIARLAGLNESAVICRIMSDDGTTAKMPQLGDLARAHGLLIGTVRDLIAYRRRHDGLVRQVAKTCFTSKWGGEWTAVSFYNKASETESMALVKGEVDSDGPVLVRVHAPSYFADLFGEEGDRHGVLEKSMKQIGREGRGVVVMINSEPSADFVSKAIHLRNAEMSGEAVPDFMQGPRDYGTGAQILAELGVRRMILLTDTQHSLPGLDGYELSIVEERSIGS